MSHKIVLRRLCYEDLSESILWYSDKANNLGEEFLEEVENCLNRIKVNPNAYTKIYKNVRRALVKRFPFGIFYIVNEDQVIVLAVFHLSRSPKKLKERI